MLKPEEKAKELINKYIAIYIDNPKFRNEYIELAKESSLLCVNEILDLGYVGNEPSSFRIYDYFSKVKIALNKL
jgi:ABC-type amino acid transport system permease subunit